MDEKNNKDSLNPEEIQIDYSLKIALIGGIFSTIGEALSTYAGSLEIAEFVQDAREQNDKDRQLEERLAAIEKKLDAFQNNMK